MLVKDYNKFVSETDQFKNRPEDERRDIALYGLVGEIGSLVSAVKKQLLAEGGTESWDHANDEIIEEFGDVIWYCFSLAQIINKGSSINILTHDIALLKKEIGANDERAKKIHAALDDTKREEFLAAAEHFPNTKSLCFNDYQNLAFLTARTDGKVLLEVCLAVLWQLGAELLRNKLPDIELTLNKSVVDRKPNIILGEIGWHLAAMVSLYRLSLDEVVARNVKKVSFRQIRGEPTALHDEGRDLSEQFPRKFEIAFITVGKGRSRMYLDGVQLGDELTDNYYEDDGYRFHDVMHLANVAHLGWSPVLRALLKRKRKRDKQIDEVEDGARATIVEEAIVKSIHSEGVRLASQRNPIVISKPVRLFPSKADITFRFLKFIHEFVRGLEVQKNKYWEWEDAILEGYRVFYELCKEEQGTVTIDLEQRSLDFRPDVFVDVRGTVCGIGSALIEFNQVREWGKSGSGVSDFLTKEELGEYGGVDDTSNPRVLRVIAVKQAIFEAMDFQEPKAQQYRMLNVRLLDNKRVSIKAADTIRREMWKRKIINFKTSLTPGQNMVGCTALAISDPGD